MNLAERATSIVATLRSADYEAFWVGGCARDTVLGRSPKDYDIVTSATPDEVIKLFPNHHLKGKQFGVVVVHYPEGNYDVATFRTEGAYSDRRRPDAVKWAGAEQDVLRRDFTMNGLLYDPLHHRVIDYVGGTRDIKLRLIRFIGDPDQRVREDPLRMLRAIRFKHELSFQLDGSTFDAIATHSSDICQIAGERIRDELNSLLSTTTRTEALNDLHRTGLLGHILPEVVALQGTPQPIEYHKEGDVYDHTLRAIDTLAADVPLFLIWAVLLHDVGKPATLAYQNSRGQPQITTYHHAEVSADIAERILRRLRFPKTEIEAITWMIAHHMSLMRIEQMRPARRETYVLDPRFPWLLELHKADAAGTVPKDLSLYAHDLKLYEKMKAEHIREKSTRAPILVDGHELQKQLQLRPGPKIGHLLEQIRDAQLAGEISSKQDAIDLAARCL